MAKLYLPLLIACFIGRSVSGQSSPSDTMDLGAPDSLYLKVLALPSVSQGRTGFEVTLYCFNDQNLIRAIGVGFKWDNPNVRLDSAVASPVANSSFDFAHDLYRKASCDTSNAHREFELFAVSMLGAGVSPSPVARPLATYFFSAREWTVYDSCAFDTSQFSAGTHYAVVTTHHVKYAPCWGGRLEVYDALRPCCLFSRGNVDGDLCGGVDAADLAYLVSYVFGDLTSLPCPDAANVNGSDDGRVDSTDISVLIEYLYGDLSALPPCPTSR